MNNLNDSNECDWPMNIHHKHILQPIRDQHRFGGRWHHFVRLTDPRTVFTSNEELYRAKSLLLKIKAGETELSTVPVRDVQRAHRLFHSSFHPDTGEIQNVVGRMSFQVWGGTAVVAGMLVWYRSLSGVLFWQFTNQSYASIMNYTNRNANAPLSDRQVLTAYVSATSTALLTAVALKTYLQTYKSGMMQRLVPFIAVMAANAVNIPIMRQNELINGVHLRDKNGFEVGQSKLAAAKGIGLVFLSRFVLNAPALMFIPPVIHRLERVKMPVRYRGTILVASQIALSALALAVSTPLSCSVFPQQSSISQSFLRKYEPSALKTDSDANDKLYFNKGL